MKTHDALGSGDLSLFDSRGLWPARRIIRLPESKKDVTVTSGR